MVQNDGVVADGVVADAVVLVVLSRCWLAEVGVGDEAQRRHPSRMCTSSWASY